MLASFEEETSAACSSWRRLSWVEAKRGIGIGVGGGIMGGGGFARGCMEFGGSDLRIGRRSREMALPELVLTPSTGCCLAGIKKLRSPYVRGGASIGCGFGGS